MNDQNIKINKLKKGNHILLETKECIFDIEIISPEQSTIFITGGRRFKNKTEATLVGVFGRQQPDDEDELLFQHEICKNLGIEIHYNTKEDITSAFVTSPVISARIYGENWEFEMWDSKETEKKLRESVEEARSRLRIKNENTKQ
jgi:hypothetical protein